LKIGKKGLQKRTGTAKRTTTLALDTIRANEIAIENSKTGKLTALVVILNRLTAMVAYLRPLFI